MICCENIVKILWNSTFFFLIPPQILVTTNFFFLPFSAMSLPQLPQIFPPISAMALPQLVSLWAPPSTSTFRALHTHSVSTFRQQEDYRNSKFYLSHFFSFSLILLLEFQQHHCRNSLSFLNSLNNLEQCP